MTDHETLYSLPPERRSSLDRYRISQLELLHKNIEAFDRVLLVLIPGSLALSFVLLERLVELRGASEVIFFPALVLAWLSWIVALVAFACGYYFSMKSVRQALSDCAKLLTGTLTKVQGEEIIEQLQSHAGDPWTQRSFRASIWALGGFVAGLVAGASFAAANLLCMK